MVGWLRGEGVGVVLSKEDDVGVRAWREESDCFAGVLGGVRSWE